MSRLQNITIPKGQMTDMKEKGRNGDTELAHLTPKEVVLPLSVQTPELMTIVDQAFQNAGLSLSQYTVENTENKEPEEDNYSEPRENPQTGEQEFWGGGLGKFVKKAVAVAAPIVGAAVGGPAGAAIGSAVGSAVGSGGSSTKFSQIGGALGGIMTGGLSADSLGGLASSLGSGQTQANGAQTNGQTQEVPKGLQSATTADIINSRPSFTTTKIAVGNNGQPTQQNIMGQTLDTSAPQVSVLPFFPVDPQHEEAALRLMEGLNSETGMQQFYDMKKLPPMRKNPETGKPEFFDASWYLKQNPDVATSPAFGNTAEAAYRHYQQYGKSEGRAGDPPAPAPAASTATASTPSNAINQKISNAVKAGQITSAEANQIIKDTGFADQIGGGRVDNWFNTNANAAKAADQKLGTLLSSKTNVANQVAGSYTPTTSAQLAPSAQTVSPLSSATTASIKQTMMPTNAINDKFVKAVQNGSLTDQEANQIYKDSGFTDPLGAGGGRIANWFNSDSNAANTANNKLQSVLASKTTASIKPSLMASNDLYNLTDNITTSSNGSGSSANGTGDIVTRTSSLSPSSSPRFRSRRYDGMGEARNF
jgi:hypothetical protein